MKQAFVKKQQWRCYMKMSQLDQVEHTLTPLHELFTESCADVFVSLNCQVEKVGDERPNLNVPCAHIEANSDDIELTLLLRGPINLLKETYPMKEQLQSIQAEELYDWLSELANRFMGDLKNKLIPFDHTLKIGIPTKEFGLDVEHFLPDGYHAYTLIFNIGGDFFECALYSKLLNDEVVFIQQNIADLMPSEGGELELF